jgi:hypothetical protein
MLPAGDDDQEVPSHIRTNLTLEIEKGLAVLRTPDAHEKKTQPQTVCSLTRGPGCQMVEGQPCTLSLLAQSGVAVDAATVIALPSFGVRAFYAMTSGMRLRSGSSAISAPNCSGICWADTG